MFKIITFLSVFSCFFIKKQSISLIFQEKATAMTFHKDTVPPVFIGEKCGLDCFLNGNIRYPALARENGIEGVVLFQITIDEQGNVKNPIITKGLADDCDKEVLRVVQKLPKFKPAQHNGQNVSFVMNLKMNFVLDRKSVSLNDSVMKQNFEKKYNNKNIDKAKTYEIVNYLLSNSKLQTSQGSFVYGNKDVVRFTLDFKKEGENSLATIYHNSKMVSILAGFQGEKHQLLDKKGEKVTMIVVKMIDKKLYLATKDWTTAQKTVNNFNFRPVTMELLKAEMEKLNKL